MQTEEILNAALMLPELERILLATRLLDSLPDEESILALHDAEFEAELERRFGDREGAVPLSQLWDDIP